MSNHPLLYLILIFVYLYPNYRLLVLHQEVIYPFIRNARSGNHLMFYNGWHLENAYDKVWQNNIRAPFVLARANDDDKSNQDSSSEETKTESQVESDTKTNENQESRSDAPADEVTKTPDDGQTNASQTAEEATKTPEDNPTNRSQTVDEVAPRPRSRIETYDEFARFRNTSRAPDSHYPLGPSPRYRSKANEILHKNTLVLVNLILNVIL